MDLWIVRVKNDIEDDYYISYMYKSRIDAINFLIVSLEQGLSASIYKDTEHK